MRRVNNISDISCICGRRKVGRNADFEVAGERFVEGFVEGFVGSFVGIFVDFGFEES
jgi:hypothetical protein